jgi:hypothetical protein
MLFLFLSFFLSLSLSLAVDTKIEADAKPTGPLKTEETDKIPP